MMGELLHKTPEALGIRSGDIQRLVDDLEHSGSEMHGMLILRHGVVAAKGWWAPYSQGAIHASQSLSKTVTGAAFGIAMAEGLLSPEDRLIDLFPEHVPAGCPPHLEDLRLKHLLTMSCGMETMPAVTDPDWIAKFFQMPIVHPPGTTFFYNSLGCSMIGACIRKKSGLGLVDYLRPRLFDRIGIDADRLRWYCHEDGLENGSGGIVTTTEDNARLIQLYLNGGVWDGQRILPEQWVCMATSMQNDHFRETMQGVAPGVGYGAMMWIRGNTYYADGAMGQLAIAFPAQDMVIAVNQTCADAASDRRMRDALYGFADRVCVAALPEDAGASEALLQRLATLSLPAPACSPMPSGAMAAIQGRRCRVEQGRAVFFPEDLVIFNRGYHDDVAAFGFASVRGALKLTVESESGVHEAWVGMDGRARSNYLPGRMPADDVLLSGSWTDPQVLRVEIRWIEVCRTRSLEFHFSGEGVQILSAVKMVGGFDVPPQTAFARWE